MKEKTKKKIKHNLQKRSRIIKTQRLTYKLSKLAANSYKIMINNYIFWFYK